MNNFKEDILKAVGTERITGIAIGDFGDWSGGHSPGLPIPPSKIGVVLEAAEALKFLDYEYDTGYGGPECHALYIWTKSRVLFVGEYDGATRIDEVPRNPTAILPVML